MMKVTIEVEVKSIAELLAVLAGGHGVSLGETGGPINLTIEQAALQAAAEEVADMGDEPKPKGRRARRPKAEEVPVTPQQEAPPEPEPAPPTPAAADGEKITLPQVREALKVYAEKHGGMEAAVKFLAQFTSVNGTVCQKISEVKDEDYPRAMKLMGVA